MNEQPETESLSIEDRIFNQFSDVPEETQGEQQPEVEASAETETESPENPGVVEVEFSGKTYQVPPELKDALMAQSDYTKKTSEVAEKARLVELRAQEFKARESEKAFHDSVKDEIAKAQRIDYEIEQYKNLDVTGLNSDQLWQVSRKIDQLKDDKQKLSESINGKYNTWQQELQRISAETLAKAREVAAKAVPNWSEATQKQIRDFAVAQGFEAQEVNGITDPRVVKILWQASQFEKLQNAKITGKQSTPSVKPGSSNPQPTALREHQAFKKQMNTAKTSSQKAKVIEAELMKRFN